jgi:hypothetical protein
MTECLAEFGVSRQTWAHAVERGTISPRPRLEPIQDLLAMGRRRNRHHVKQRLFAAGLKDERCESCGITEWRGAPISLELHHVNGDGLDNRIENLRVLCRNCHSQTDTWGGRNRRRDRAAWPGSAYALNPSSARSSWDETRAQSPGGAAATITELLLAPWTMHATST